MLYQRLKFTLNTFDIEPSPYPDHLVDHAGFRVTLSPIPPSIQTHLSLSSFNDYAVEMTVVKSHVLRF
jgi:hypothetical protein